MMTKEELIKYIGDFGEREAAIMISCKDCPLAGSCGKEHTIGNCEDNFSEFYTSKTETKAKVNFVEDEEEKVSIGRLEKGDCFLYGDKAMVIGEVKSEEDLFNYIDVFGLEKTTMRLSCGNCPLADLANDDCEYGLERCKNRLRDFYMTRRGKSNSLRTAVSVIFEGEENNQVAIKDLSVGTFFIFCNRLYEVIKNAEGGIVKVKEWNTSEIGSFADEVKVEVVDIEIKVKRRKED